jgi:hypothetical protein
MKYVCETPWGSLFFMTALALYNENRMAARYTRIGPFLLIKSL